MGRGGLRTGWVGRRPVSGRGRCRVPGPAGYLLLQVPGLPRDQATVFNSSAWASLAGQWCGQPLACQEELQVTPRGAVNRSQSRPRL